MKDLKSELAKVIFRNAAEEGMHASVIPGVHWFRLTKTNKKSKQNWGSSLCIIMQGCKSLILDQKNYRLQSADYVATPVDLPLESQLVSASTEKPFLCLKIELDPVVLSELASQITAQTDGDEASRAIFVGRANDKMLEAALRLGNISESSDEAAILGPLIVKEILYHLLKGEGGAAICQFVRSGSSTHKVSQAIYTLKNELDGEFDIDTLAKKANMSRSAFFKHFKDATSMSPIQYQKRLRLLEAQRLMIEDGESVEGSAFRVGYNSASQFSREYSRMFGNSPLRDAMKIKKQIAETTGV